MQKSLLALAALLAILLGVWWVARAPSVIPSDDRLAEKRNVNASHLAGGADRAEATKWARSSAISVRTGIDEPPQGSKAPLVMETGELMPTDDPLVLVGRHPDGSIKTKVRLSLAGEEISRSEFINGDEHRVESTFDSQSRLLRKKVFVNDREIEDSIFR